MRRGWDAVRFDNAFLLRLAAFAAAALLLVATLDVARHSFRVDGETYRILNDDVMIGLRAARNLALGHGPYFNPGERVAAVTSLSWPNLLAPLFGIFSAERAILAATTLSIALTLGIFALIAATARTAIAAMLALALMATSRSLVEYAPSAWEHIPQALFATAGLLAILGRIPAFGRYGLEAGLLLLAAAFLFRVDTAPMLTIPAACFLWRLVRAPRLANCALLAVLAAVPAAQLLLHQAIYGDIVPNTYHLKVGGEAAGVADGLAYLATNVVVGGNAALVLALAALTLPAWRTLTASERIVLGACAAQVVYIVAIGGDVFSHGRFFLVIQPIVTLLLAERLVAAAAAMPRRAGHDATASLAAMLVAATLVAATYHDTARSDGHRPLYGAGPALGLEPEAVRSQVALAPVIRAHIRPEDGQVGLFWLGALSYYLPEFAAADFLGKADPVIARTPVHWGPVGHNKWDFAWSLRERHVAVVPFPPPLDPAEARRIVESRRGIGAFAAFQLDPAVAAGYTYLSAARLGQNHGWGLYVRNDLVGRFAPETGRQR